MTPEQEKPQPEPLEEEKKLAEVLDVFAQICGAMRHEIFQDLTTVLGHSELILMDSIDNRDLKERLEKVIVASKALESILDGFDVFNAEVQSLAKDYVSRGAIDKDAIARAVTKSLADQIDIQVAKFKEAITQESVDSLPPDLPYRDHVLSVLNAIGRMSAAVEVYKNIKRYAVKEYISTTDPKTGRVKQVFILDSQAASAPPDVDKS